MTTKLHYKQICGIKRSKLLHQLYKRRVKRVELLQACKDKLLLTENGYSETQNRSTKDKERGETKNTTMETNQFMKVCKDTEKTKTMEIQNSQKVINKML